MDSGSGEPSDAWTRGSPKVVNEPNQEVKMLPQLTLHLIEKLRQTQEVKRVSEQNHSQEKKNKDAYRP
jgi:hypothetical protein